MGVDVTIVPTQPIRSGNPWPDRLASAGCRIIETSLDDLQSVPGLAGSIISGWCNGSVCEAWGELQSLGCRLIWSPCMTYVAPHERRAFRKAPPAAVHFQSHYQCSQLTEWYERIGCEPCRQHIIPGAFEMADFPFEPSPRCRREFVVGRLARPDRTKWNRSLFSIMAALRERRTAAEMLCMGWNRETEAKCGTAPTWAKGFAPESMTSQYFLSQCHALLCLNGGDEENWPRVGLEAMASGVPVVAERRWGWLEMIEDGVTGMLCDTPSDFVNALARLANDEPFRLAIVENARKAVEKMTDPNRLGTQWVDLFQTMEDQTCSA
jgi:hypothetical protein